MLCAEIRWLLILQQVVMEFNWMKNNTIRGAGNSCYVLSEKMLREIYC